MHYSVYHYREVSENFSAEMSVGVSRWLWGREEDHGAQGLPRVSHAWTRAFFYSHPGSRHVLAEQEAIAKGFGVGEGGDGGKKGCEKKGSAQLREDIRLFPDASLTLQTSSHWSPISSLLSLDCFIQELFLHIYPRLA